MNEAEEATTPDFWSARYVGADTPWALDFVPAALTSFFSRSQKRGRVLVPGCGSDWRVIQAFDRAGFEVSAVDFSPAAVEITKRMLPPQLRDKVVAADFFEYDPRDKFDLIYERTFLCALPPSRWPDYARHVAELLNRAGLLAGLFFYGVQPDPPPYPISESKAQELFGTGFQLRRNEPVSDSLEMFAAMERWQEWERCPASYGR